MTSTRLDPEDALAALRVLGAEPEVPYAYVVGRVLAVLRQERGLSQDELAHRSGLTQSALSRLELGETVLNVEHLMMLARALKMTPAAIVRRADGLVAELKQHNVGVAEQRHDASPLGPLAAKVVLKATGASPLLGALGGLAASAVASALSGVKRQRT